MLSVDEGAPRPHAREAGSTAAGVAALAALQRADGAFPAEVELDGRALVDHNVFVTVHVVAALTATGRAPSPAVAAIRDGALGYLAAARSPSGTSNHWPAADQPAWLPRLPDDADDTALVTRALIEHGLLDRRQGASLLLRELAPCRLAADPRAAPAWTAAGGFRTWLVRGARRNPLDAVVNANVLAALAALGLAGASGYAEACALVRAAVSFARHAPAALRTTVAPFYPDLHELDLAITRAASAGVHELAGLPALAPPPTPAEVVAPWIARAAYGRPRWRSHAVGLARRLDHTATKERS